MPASPTISGFPPPTTVPSPRGSVAGSVASCTWSTRTGSGRETRSSVGPGTPVPVTAAERRLRVSVAVVDCGSTRGRHPEHRMLLRRRGARAGRRGRRAHAAGGTGRGDDAGPGDFLVLVPTGRGYARDGERPAGRAVLDGGVVTGPGGWLAGNPPRRVRHRTGLGRWIVGMWSPCWSAPICRCGERTLWRMLHETAARAEEILGLDVEELDLRNRRARVGRKGGAADMIVRRTATAHLRPACSASAAQAWCSSPRAGPASPCFQATWTRTAGWQGCPTGGPRSASPRHPPGPWELHRLALHAHPARTPQPCWRTPATPAWPPWLATRGFHRPRSLACSPPEPLHVAITDHSEPAERGEA
ncbi:hypothetical protein LV78_005289 [Actinosynnema pretiosum]|nr:hypothetical protein [Actinosynnema pretiosum]